MTEQHLILERNLSQLEVDKAGIEHAIIEIQRRFALLDEVESWGLVEKNEPIPDYHPSARRYDGYEIQDNYGDSEVADSAVPAGYF